MPFPRALPTAPHDGDAEPHGGAGRRGAMRLGGPLRPLKGLSRDSKRVFWKGIQLGNQGFSMDSACFKRLRWHVCQRALADRRASDAAAAPGPSDHQTADPAHETGHLDGLRQGIEPPEQPFI